MMSHGYTKECAFSDRQALAAVPARVALSLADHADHVIAGDRYLGFIADAVGHWPDESKRRVRAQMRMQSSNARLSGISIVIQHDRQFAGRRCKQHADPRREPQIFLIENQSEYMADGANGESQRAPNLCKRRSLNLTDN